jgi:hypothetical protein
MEKLESVGVKEGGKQDESSQVNSSQVKPSQVKERRVRNQNGSEMVRAVQEFVRKVQRSSSTREVK